MPTHPSRAERGTGRLVDPGRSNPREAAVSAIRVIENDDGLWAVTAQGLVVTGLTRESAEAFAAAFLRLRDGQAPGA